MVDFVHIWYIIEGGGAGPFSGRRDWPFFSSGIWDLENLSSEFREKIMSGRGDIKYFSSEFLDFQYRDPGLIYKTL